MEYIQYIKTIPSQEGQQAETALFRRQIDEAERIFLNATPPLVYRAVKMNIRFYRWSRALDIALKFRTHVDTVLAYRQRFLEQFNKRESDQQFIQYASQVCTVIACNIILSDTGLAMICRLLLIGMRSWLKSRKRKKMKQREAAKPLGTVASRFVVCWVH